MFLNDFRPRAISSSFPRVCGDVPKLKTSSKASTTFSPRMRGCSLFTGDLNFRDQVFPAYAGMFLVVVAWAEVSSQFSPRMRGCSGKHLMIDQNPDVFPAYAGMFRCKRKGKLSPNGFPRVCGDVPPPKGSKNPLIRFSPRMRGCSEKKGKMKIMGIVFPAYAGMFRIKPMIEGQDDCFPRVCGDVPPMRQKPRLRQRFSPRMRGCSCFPLVRFIHIAVFPAYAGMFRRYLSPDHGARRFPRVCGDVPIERALAVVLEKFSPRMRGCS